MAKFTGNKLSITVRNVQLGAWKDDLTDTVKFTANAKTKSVTCRSKIYGSLCDIRITKQRTGRLVEYKAELPDYDDHVLFAKSPAKAFAQAVQQWW